MRGNIPAYELIAPRTLAEVLARLSAEPGVWRPFAGGTDLMVLLESGHLAHTKFISLWGLAGLDRIEVTESGVTIGALATYTDIAAHPVIRTEFPNLVAAARETGALAIQNRGTIGGNIANASPAADTPPALLCHDASLELVSSRGARIIPYSQFHLGYKKTALAPDELIHRVIVPRAPKGAKHSYRKVGTRRAQAISKVCFAGVIAMDSGRVGDVRIALGSVAATPIRASRTEALLRGATLDATVIRSAAATLASEITPIDDIRSTAEYRLRVARHLLEEFLAP